MSFHNKYLLWELDESYQKYNLESSMCLQNPFVASLINSVSYDSFSL